MNFLKTVAAVAAIGAMTLQTAVARDQIRIVGSSTVYPFSTYVAEEFGATTNFEFPVVESTGSGGGHKLFSEGVGEIHPDVTNSSRRMKVSEFERNLENGVDAIHEVKIGYDGIAIAHHIDNPELSLSVVELALAVAEQVPVDGTMTANPYMYWDEINPSLPHAEILIYGPPTSSGTRDAFEELVLEVASEQIEGMPEGYSAIRQDDAYVPSGENDNLIVQRLVQDKKAVGIFGYSFLTENEDRIQGATINGVKPTPEAIATGEYPVSRSLFFYVKLAHLDVIPGLEEFVDLFLSEKMIGDRGYLKRIGLIPLTAEERDAARKAWNERTLLKKTDLE